jgi:DNA polymerase III delta prime subunit
MASQNIKIQDSSIENSPIQQIEAGRDAISLQNSPNSKIIIDRTFVKLFSQPDRSEVDWDWGMKLLKKKQLPEIRKRLSDTLGRDRILMDVSIEEEQSWINRSPLAADRILQIDDKKCGKLDPSKMLIETFSRDDIEGKLLILGEPGAGKTTTLLSLAEQLMCEAISNSQTVIPVVFELSTWNNDHKDIQSWLIEQLYKSYGGNRKLKIYEQWLEQQVLLPLLDGLDELGLENQKKCTKKLDEFADNYPHLVICCRVKEFKTVDIKLRNLRGAVCLQSLSDSQIQHYFDTLKRPELWRAIQNNPFLQDLLEPDTDGNPGLLRVPLFVKLLADVYNPQQPISSKADLLDKYIDLQLSFDKREFDRRKELKGYKWAYKTEKVEPDYKQSRITLNWLAKSLQEENRVDLLIEEIHPICMTSDRLFLRYRLIYQITFTLIFGILFWLTSKQTNGFFIGVSVGFFVTRFDVLQLPTILAIVIGFFVTIYGLITASIDLLTAKLIGEVIFGIIFGVLNFSNQLMIIKPVETFLIFKFDVVWREIVNILVIMLFTGATFAVISQLIFGIFFGVDGAVENGLKSGLIFGMVAAIEGCNDSLRLSREFQEFKVHLQPNEGIWNSLYSQVLTTATIFIPTILLLTIFSWVHYWELGLFFSIIIGFDKGGGHACLQHLFMRIVLWQSGLPWNFACFLNYCVERRLLLRVGGSYRFLHRELLDHFAQSSS